MGDQTRQAGREIEITKEMIEAGVSEARERLLGASVEELVRKVLIAMIVETYSDMSSRDSSIRPSK